MPICLFIQLVNIKTAVFFGLHSEPVGIVEFLFFVKSIHLFSGLKDFQLIHFSLIPFINLLEIMFESQILM